MLFSQIIWILKYYWEKISPNLLLKIKDKLLQSISCLQDWEILEICLGSTSWPPSRTSNTKWLSLVSLSGKRHSEVSHVLGGGPRQRGPCKTQLETWPWDRVLEESALTVPCPGACSYKPSIVNRHHHGLSLRLQVDTLSFFSLFTLQLSLNPGAVLVTSRALSPESYHTFIVKNCLLFVFSHMFFFFPVEDDYLALHLTFVFALYMYILLLCSCWVTSNFSATPWAVAHQAPLSMVFLRQVYWSRLPFPSPGGSSAPRDRTHVSCVGRWILYHWTTRGFPMLHILIKF